MGGYPELSSRILLKSCSNLNKHRFPSWEQLPLGHLGVHSHPVSPHPLLCVPFPPISIPTENTNSGPRGSFLWASPRKNHCLEGIWISFRDSLACISLVLLSLEGFFQDFAKFQPAALQPLHPHPVWQNFCLIFSGSSLGCTSYVFC